MGIGATGPREPTNFSLPQSGSQQREELPKPLQECVAQIQEEFSKTLSPSIARIEQLLTELKEKIAQGGGASAVEETQDAIEATLSSLRGQLTPEEETRLHTLAGNQKDQAWEAYLSLLRQDFSPQKVLTEGSPTLTGGVSSLSGLGATEPGDLQELRNKLAPYKQPPNSPEAAFVTDIERWIDSYTGPPNEIRQSLFFYLYGRGGERAASEDLYMIYMQPPGNPTTTLSPDKVAAIYSILQSERIGNYMGGQYYPIPDPTSEMDKKFVAFLQAPHTTPGGTDLWGRILYFFQNQYDFSKGYTAALPALKELIAKALIKFPDNAEILGISTLLGVPKNLQDLLSKLAPYQKPPGTPEAILVGNIETIISSYSGPPEGLENNLATYLHNTYADTSAATDLYLLYMQPPGVDNPTSTLSPDKVGEIFRILNGQGISVADPTTEGDKRLVSALFQAPHTTPEAEALRKQLVTFFQKGYDFSKSYAANLPALEGMVDPARNQSPTNQELLAVSRLLGIQYLPELRDQLAPYLTPPNSAEALFVTNLIHWLDNYAGAPADIKKALTSYLNTTYSGSSAATDLYMLYMQPPGNNPTTTLSPDKVADIYKVLNKEGVTATDPTSDFDKTLCSFLHAPHATPEGTALWQQLLSFFQKEYDFSKSYAANMPFLQEKVSKAFTKSPSSQEVVQIATILGLQTAHIWWRDLFANLDALHFPAGSCDAAFVQELEKLALLKNPDGSLIADNKDSQQLLAQHLDTRYGHPTKSGNELYFSHRMPRGNNPTSTLTPDGVAKIYRLLNAQGVAVKDPTTDFDRHFSSFLSCAHTTPEGQALWQQILNIFQNSYDFTKSYADNLPLLNAPIMNALMKYPRNQEIRQIANSCIPK